MRHGAGTFVREVPTDRKTEERLERARAIAQQALQEAARMGIASRELLGALQEQVGQGVPASANSEQDERSRPLEKRT
jgi:DNA-binding transcriptional regulator YhcF (GntR family)